ncbi:MAG: efflux RND transporter periplasmic adaptor subunit [Acidobacteriota bacterium]
MFLCVVLALLGLAGSIYSYNVRAPGERNSTPGAILFYRDPMHPAYVSDKPGIAPDCGMALEPVYASSTTATPAIVHVNAEKQQLIGVVLGRVEKGPADATFRSVGRVVADETRVFPITAGADGAVVNVFGITSDEVVRKGQPLLSVSGNDYMTVQRTILYGLRAMELTPRTAAQPQDPAAFSMDEARLSFRSIGLSEEQFQDVAKTRKLLTEIPLLSPVTGTVVARHVFAGQAFKRGTELLRVADLSRVWIELDIFGADIQHIQNRATARVFVSGSTQAVQAKVVEAARHFDAGSGALKVRLEVDNANLVLRPGMLAHVEISRQVSEALTVPIDAVIDSGLQKTVYVERGSGTFEPRRVETGRRFGDRVEILRGLDAGESIVVSGNFLLDSESRMHGAAHTDLKPSN